MLLAQKFHTFNEVTESCLKCDQKGIGVWNFEPEIFRSWKLFSNILERFESREKKTFLIDIQFFRHVLNLPDVHRCHLLFFLFFQNLADDRISVKFFEDQKSLDDLIIVSSLIQKNCKYNFFFINYHPCVCVCVFWVYVSGCLGGAHYCYKINSHLLKTTPFRGLEGGYG